MTPCEILLASAFSFSAAAIDRFDALLFDLNPYSYVSVIDHLSESDAKEMRNYINGHKKGMASFTENGALYVIQFRR